MSPNPVAGGAPLPPVACAAGLATKALGAAEVTANIMALLTRIDPRLIPGFVAAAAGAGAAPLQPAGATLADVAALTPTQRGAAQAASGPRGPEPDALK